MERTMILASEGEIDVNDLPQEIREFEAPPEAPTDAVSATSPSGVPFVTLEELEERYILEVLTATGNNKTHAARILGIHPTSLARRLKRIPEESEVLH
jgi:DNA-binding NtrC family response regulator